MVHQQIVIPQKDQIQALPIKLQKQCNCTNPTIGLVEYKEIVSLNLHSRNWQNSLKSILRYINNYQKTNISTFELMNYITWFKHCVSCGKEYTNTQEVNNKYSSTPID